MWCHKRLWLITGVGLLVLSAHAASAQGAGFKYKASDREGNTKYLITATKATPSPTGVMTLQNARLEVYGDGKVESTITAASCDYDRGNHKLNATGDVLIVREGVRISGQGLTWDDETKQVIIKDKAKVQIADGKIVRKKPAKP